MKTFPSLFQGDTNEALGFGDLEVTVMEHLHHRHREEKNIPILPGLQFYNWLMSWEFHTLQLGIVKNTPENHVLHQPVEEVHSSKNSPAQ
jgi:hypothetical protein